MILIKISKSGKFRFSTSKIVGFICFNVSPLKTMKNAFYFVSNVCPEFLDRLEKRLDETPKINFKI